MLRSLPYTGVRQEGTLTTIEFARNKFPISGELSDRITKGEFRVVPVVQFLGQNGKVHTAILDSGDPYWHSQSRKKSNTRTEHYFFTAGCFYRKRLVAAGHYGSGRYQCNLYD